MAVMLKQGLEFEKENLAVMIDSQCYCLMVVTLKLGLQTYCLVKKVGKPTCLMAIHEQ